MSPSFKSYRALLANLADVQRPHFRYNETPVVGIAQLAEHRTVAPTVAGSIPVSHPNFSFLTRDTRPRSSTG